MAVTFFLCFSGGWGVGPREKLKTEASCSRCAALEGSGEWMTTAGNIAEMSSRARVIYNPDS